MYKILILKTGKPAANNKRVFVLWVRNFLRHLLRIILREKPPVIYPYLKFYNYHTMHSREFKISLKHKFKIPVILKKQNKDLIFFLINAVTLNFIFLTPNSGCVTLL